MENISLNDWRHEAISPQFAMINNWVKKLLLCFVVP